MAGVALLLCAALFGALALARRESPPNVPPPKPAVLPAAALRVLPNGLKVVVIERHSLPLVTLRLTVKTGAEGDPPHLPGTAQMVAGLLNEGTTHRSAREIAEAIDGVGGSVDAGADWDDSFAGISVLSDRTDLAFNLLSDMVIHPAFAPAEVERIRKQTVSTLELMRTDPAYVADNVFNRVELGGTAYGHPADGTLESVGRITPGDLRDFHAKHYRPSNALLAVVGDVTAAEAFRRADQFFGGWTELSGAASRGLLSLVPERPRRVIVIDKPDAVQTEIRVGNLGIRRASPDYFALTVANQVLGGPAANRLFKALRTEHGLTYSASSELVCHEITGSWEAKTSTRSAETVKSVDLLVEQIKLFRDGPISGPELENARNYLIGHLALEFESAEGIATETLDLMVHGLPLDYWNRFPEKIQALTAEEVLATTRQYLDPDRAVIVLVGNVAAFKKDLKKLGPAQIIPLRDVDLSSPNLVRTGAAGKNSQGR